MVLSRSKAAALGAVAILGVVALQAFIGAACYGHGPQRFLTVLGTFLLVPLLPAIVALATANPLRAVGACLLFAPWLAWAYRIDCIGPDAGGGASMAYVSVLLWGTPCSLLGALLAGPVSRALGISVVRR